MLEYLRCQASQASVTVFSLLLASHTSLPCVTIRSLARGTGNHSSLGSTTPSLHDYGTEGPAPGPAPNFEANSHARFSPLPTQRKTNVDRKSPFPAARYATVSNVVFFEGRCRLLSQCEKTDATRTAAQHPPITQGSFGVILR
jgi:hypothetical protein